MEISNQQIDLFTCGMAFMMMLYMAMRSFQPNGDSYRKYALYLLCMNIFFFLMYFVWYIFVPTNPRTDGTIHIGIISTLSQTFAYIFYFSFVASFLNLKKNLPGIDLLFKYVQIICFVFILATLFIVYVLKNGWLANRSFEVVRIGLCVVSFYGMIKAYKLKDPLTNYFIVGNGLYLFFALICWGISIYDRNVLQYSKLQAFFGGLQPAVLAESICFALGLSYKDTILEREKQFIQQQLITQLQLSNQQQKEFTDQLEIKVNEQTEVLVNLQKEKFELEKMQAVNQERGRIARDMHDDLGSGLSAIHLLSNYLKENTVEKYPELSHEIGKISSSSEDLNERIREIIWTTNTRDDTLHSLIMFISRFGHELQEKTKTKILVDAPDPVPDLLLSGEQRKQVFLVIKEAINNAMKHGKPTEINIHIRMETDQSISIQIVDNGIGFNKMDITSSHQGNGLQNMKERIAEIKGTVEIESGPGGTSVNLRFKP